MSSTTGGGEYKKFDVENRLSEFYTLDDKYKLYIWALGKNVNVKLFFALACNYFFAVESCEINRLQIAASTNII